MLNKRDNLEIVELSRGNGELEVPMAIIGVETDAALVILPCSNIVDNK